MLSGSAVFAGIAAVLMALGAALPHLPGNLLSKYDSSPVSDASSARRGQKLPMETPVAAQPSSSTGRREMRELPLPRAPRRRRQLDDADLTRLARGPPPQALHFHGLRVGVLHVDHVDMRVDAPVAPNHRARVLRRP